MSCLQNTQALPAGAGTTTLTAGLTGQLPNQVMWQTYLPQTHRVVTFDSAKQSPYEGGPHNPSSCYKTPNGVCLGSPDAGVPWMTSSSAQMNAMKQMYTPYVGVALASPGMAAMQLAASRGPVSNSGGACAYKFLDAMPL